MVCSGRLLVFFPRAMLNSIDFISEKWRKCRRTRTLAYVHLAFSFLPMVYVAVYAEAQRRDEDYKEFGAAIAALMFNVYQAFRTVVGILQLNVFLAWCKDAVKCSRALLGRGGEDSEGSRVRRCRRETGKFCVLVQLQVFVTWCKQGIERMCGYGSEDTSYDGQNSTTDEEDIKISSNWSIGTADDYYVDDTEQVIQMNNRIIDDEFIEEMIQVNNTVVDNELGGKEMKVLPS